MIFGSSRAITRKNSQIGGCHTLVVDIADVKHLGVSAALALEESILEMTGAGRSVYIVTTREQALERLGRLDVLKNIPEDNILVDRQEVLERAREELREKKVLMGDDDSDSASNTWLNDMSLSHK